MRVSESRIMQASGKRGRHLHQMVRVLHGRRLQVAGQQGERLFDQLVRIRNQAFIKRCERRRRSDGKRQILIGFQRGLPRFIELSGRRRLP